MKASKDQITIANNSIKTVTLGNPRGSSVKVLALGATLDSFKIPLEGGSFKELVVSPIDKEYYLQQFEHVPYYFGATVGRYAGRLGKPFIIIEGKSYKLTSEGEVHLHGGPFGLSKKMWELKATEADEMASATFVCKSPHLEGGYPGNLHIEVKYTLQEDDSLEILYTAIADRTTILNLTNHVYFNLGNGTILDQVLQINASHILETERNLVPTGRRIPVMDSAYDFRTDKEIAQIEKISGLDTTYCFDQLDANAPKIIYKAKETGLKMEVFSNQKSAVVFAPSSLSYKKNIDFNNFTNNHYPSICFEMQNYPDAPNHASFPKAVLRKGEKYINKTVYKVSTSL